MRPIAINFDGGVAEVLKSFIIAKGNIDLDLLINYLDSINYTYPYHQSIGFYMEMAGYDKSQISELKRRDKPVDFYLEYAMEDATYSKDWRLYYPKILNK